MSLLGNSRKSWTAPVRNFINIGRYAPEKGQERLIRAFDTFWHSHPKTWLIIIGGMGDLYESLRRLARSLESGRHIVLLKSMSNPMPVLKRCDFFYSLLFL